MIVIHGRIHRLFYFIAAPQLPSVHQYSVFEDLRPTYF
jgi:hypothetical protein